MPLLTTKPTDQLFERFMKHQPNFKPDAPEADRIQAELDAGKERKEARPMIYRDDRHHHTFEKEAAMRPESISRALLAALYLLTADKNLWNQVKGCGSVNRPTPGSQRPAEPVASGFSPGVNSPVFVGQFWSLGVKPWVREQENPEIPGKIRGSNCGFGPKSEGEKAYDRTEIPCARKA